MYTEESLGYQDAMRQVNRAVRRRLKNLEEELKEASKYKQTEIRIRIAEVEHLLNVIESLHR